MSIFYSEPVHSKKRKHERVIDKYEKIPRPLQTAPEKELIHLLPIKDKSGVIPQTREKPGESTQPVYYSFSSLTVSSHVYIYISFRSNFNVTLTYPWR